VRSQLESASRKIFPQTCLYHQELARANNLPVKRSIVATPVPLRRSLRHGRYGPSRGARFDFDEPRAHRCPGA